MRDFNITPRFSDADFDPPEKKSDSMGNRESQKGLTRREIGLAAAGAVGTGILAACYMGVENIPGIREIRRQLTSRMHRIRHLPDQKELSPEGKKLLDPVAQTLVNDHSAVVHVYGGYRTYLTDPLTNRGMGEDRVSEIVGYLAEQGVSINQVVSGRRGRTESLQDFSEIVLYHD